MFNELINSKLRFFLNINKIAAFCIHITVVNITCESLLIGEKFKFKNLYLKQ